MALLDIEGFDGVSTEAQLQRIRHCENFTTTINTTGDPFGGGRWDTTPAGYCVLKPGVDTGPTAAITRLIGGMLCRITNTDAGELFRLSGPNTTHCTIELGTAGEFRLYNGASTFLDSAVYPYPRPYMKRNAWHWVEFDITCANSPTGAATIWLDGVQAASWTSVDTFNGITTGILGAEFYTSSDHNLQYAACYLMDTNGTANNSRLGPFHVETITPNGDGGTTDFTPLSGLTNYEMIDDPTPDDATTYVSSSTLNHTDYYTYTNLSTGAGTGNFDTVAGVRVVSTIRKPSAGDRLIRAAISSGLSTGESVPDGVPIDWFASRSMFEQDPDTATAWTVSGINAAEFGITIES